MPQALQGEGTSAAALEVVDVEDGLHLRQQVPRQLPDLGVEQRRVVARADPVQLACGFTEPLARSDLKIDDQP